jgi:ubiquinone/menaquinone biosynthesis C-methylase UbiE
MNLLEHLNNRCPFKDDIWLGSLNNRKKEEAHFHDFQRGSNDLQHQKDLHVNDNLKFYKIVSKSKSYVRHWLRRNVLGKVFLDYACGESRHSTDILEYSKPAMVVGIDISAEAIRQVTEKVKSGGFSQAYFIQGDCEHTEFPDNAFDVILCSEMLHHLEFENAFRELYRILAPGGRVLCVEALGINPFIQWYRKHTPQSRTAFEQEHILTLKAFDVAKNCGFSIESVRFWHLFAIPAAFFVKIPFIFKSLLVFGNILDSIFLKIPYIQRLAWQFTFILKKSYSGK